MPCAQCAIITFSTKGKIFRVCAMILVYVKRGKVLSPSFEKKCILFLLVPVFRMVQHSAGLEGQRLPS